MKYCPHCRTTYADDALRFCLQDGSVLVGEPARTSVTGGDAAQSSEPETVVSKRRRRQQPQNWQSGPQSELNRAGAGAHTPRKSNTALVVISTALVTLLLVGGIGAWFLWRDPAGDPEAARKNSDSTKSNSGAVSSSSPPQAGDKNPAEADNPSNTNMDTNRLIVVNAAPPSPTENENVNSSAPAKSPSPAAVHSERVESEISESVMNWKSALESGSLNNFLGHYADRLDYYFNSRDVGIGAVRADKQRAFALFSDFRLKIDNLRVAPDEGGARATAVFDKEWEFEGAGSRDAGKVQSQLQLTKIGGRWRITGERDLKIYYLEK